MGSIISLFYCAAWAGSGHIELSASQSKGLVGSIEFYECRLSNLSELFSRKAECAYVNVPENHQQPDSKQLDIFVARLKSNAAKAKKDAVLMIAGGPGQAASQAYLNADRIYKKVSRQRDIYLIDQRGTGRSNRMDCPELSSVRLEKQFDANLAKTLTKACLENLPGDPRFYTTSVAIKDLELIRKALAIPQWNLMGASYGSRVELHYLKKYPKSIRTAVMDSVIPPEYSLGPAIAMESQRALEKMFEACRLDDDCNDKYPNLEQGVSSLLDGLEKSPRDITIENFSTGKQESIKYTKNHLAVVLRFSLYSHLTVSILPAMLHEAYANNNLAPLARQSMGNLKQLNNMLSVGMHHAVLCTEDFPFFKESDLERNSSAATYLGDAIIEGIKSTCEVWPSGIIDKDFKQAVASDVPVLLFSGSADPITPPSYADVAAKHLSDSLHIVVQGQGHGVSHLGCAPTIVAKFIDMASFDGIKTKCLDKIKPAPFFIDFNGPSA